jgi:hypothetical protein
MLSEAKHLWPNFHCMMPPKMDLRFFAPLRMTIGFGLCFKLRLRNIPRCRNWVGWQ